MPRQNHSLLGETKRWAPTAVVFALLVGIGVVGRWGQPEFAVTPIAAVGLLAGYALPAGLALAVPLAAMAVTDLVLPSYGSFGLAAAVYGSMGVSALLGRMLRRPAAGFGTGAARLTVVAAIPAGVFFVVTNLAVWAFTSTYPTTYAGLAACYAAAVPFLGKMLAGDLAYAGVLFGTAWAAGVFSLRGVVPAATRSAAA